MRFMYKDYLDLIVNLRKNRYVIQTYDKFNISGKVCILRHDIDTSIDKALELSKVEDNLNRQFKNEEVHSTWFVLLTSDFYNVFSKDSVKKIREIMNGGGQIGLHFDEKRYIEDEKDFDEGYIKEKVKEEALILSNLLNTDINVVSMHRPSKTFLNADIKFDGIINSYSKEFFNEFKYVSDSRRNWRENVDSIIESGKYDRLHILTHAFWYNEEEISLYDTMKSFFIDSKYRAWDIMNDNFTNLEEVIRREDI